MKTKLLLSFWLLQLVLANTNLISQNYVTYHHRTFNAEKLIAVENYSAALAVYDSTFTEYPHATSKEFCN